jgi:hypothetical protein
MSKGKRNKLNKKCHELAKEFDVILNLNYNNYHYDKFIHIHCDYMKKYACLLSLPNLLYTVAVLKTLTIASRSLAKQHAFYQASNTRPVIIV